MYLNRLPNFRRAAQCGPHGESIAKDPQVMHFLGSGILGEIYLRQARGIGEAHGTCGVSRGDLCRHPIRIFQCGDSGPDAGFFFFDLMRRLGYPGVVSQRIPC